MFERGHKILKKLYDLFGVAEKYQSNCMHQYVAINTLPWPRKEIVEVSATEVAVVSGQGHILPLQSFQLLDDKPGVTLEESAGIFTLTNDQLRVVVENGVITSLYDRINDREVIEKGGEGNKFVIFDDIPLYWQAWDVEVYHLGTRRQLEYGETRVYEQKDHRVTLVTDIRISDKSYLQSFISLSAALKGEDSQVECSAEVEWHENSKFLKVEFPVEIVNTEASYETAYSITKRPTHYNTSWDMAKFEVCCHKFADLSEHNYGVSILNDSKYGFATAGKLMRLSLLRSPKAPDAHADMGRHSIRWAIFPHKGALSSSTVKAAYAFNSPLKLLTGLQSATSSLSKPFIKLTNDDVSESLVLDTIKRGHDDEDIAVHDSVRVNSGKSVILRIYESLGGHSRGTISAAFDIKRASKVNILEDELEEAEVKDGKVSIKLRPFEVATFKLQL